MGEALEPIHAHILPGHTDMNTTKRYVHPSAADILEAMEKVRGGHMTGHSQETTSPEGSRAAPTIN